MRGKNLLATPDDNASIMIVISVDDERDLNIFVFGFVLNFRKSKANCSRVEENYSNRLARLFKEKYDKA